MAALRIFAEQLLALRALCDHFCPSGCPIHYTDPHSFMDRVRPAANRMRVNRKQTCDESNPMMTAILATFATGVFAGAALCISIIRAC